MSYELKMFFQSEVQLKRAIHGSYFQELIMRYTHKDLMKKIYVVAALMMVNVLALNAQAPTQITTTGVPFLQITPDTRAGGMGNIGLATSADADAIFHNLSKTAFMDEKAGISANYTPWLRKATSGMSFVSLSGFCKKDELQAFSASLRYFNMGDVPVNDYAGKYLGTYKPNEFAIDLGYSRKLGQKISLGLTARYIYSKLADGTVNNIAYSAGHAFAADLSAYYNGINKEGNGWTAGVALTNLGSKISYTKDDLNKAFLPATAGAGVAYTKKFDEVNKLTIGIEGGKLLVPAVSYDEAAMKDYNRMGVFESWTKSFSNNAFNISGGAEYTYNDMVNLRAGYYFENSEQGTSGRKYVTAGVGLHYSDFEIHFAYLVPTGMSTTESTMTNTLRFGVVYNIRSK